jgi:hypothetical protein
MNVHYLLLDLRGLLQEQTELRHVVLFMFLRVVVTQFSYNTEMRSTLGSVTEVNKTKKLNCVALVRERIIPTELPPLIGELSANFCG